MNQEQGFIGPGEGLDWTRSKVGLDKEQGWIGQGDGFELTRMQNSSKMNSISLEEEMTEFINNQVILDRGWGCERGGLAKKRKEAVRNTSFTAPTSI